MPDFLSIQPVNRPAVDPNPQMSLYSPSAGAPVTPGTPGPTYADVIAKLNAANGSGDATFNKGVSTVQDQLTAPGTIDPGYQKTLDQIKSNAAYYGNQATSAASSLAAKRGITGSSTEAFGVQTGLDNVNRTAADQTAAVYQQNLARQQALQDQLTQLYGNRAGQQTTQGTTLATTGAQLTSDEVASQRNALLYQQQLAVQQSLGQQGIAVSQANIDAAKKMAQQNGWFSLGAAVAAGATPTVLAALAKAWGPSGTAAGSGIPGLSGGAPLANGAIPGAGVAFGPGGSILNTAGTSAIGAGTVAGGAIGVYGAEKAFGDNSYVNTGAVAGAVGGSAFGPAGSAVGAVAGGAVGKYGDQAYTSLRGSIGAAPAALAKPFIDPVGSAVDAAQKLGITSGKSHVQMQYSGRDYSQYDIGTIAQNLGKPGWGVDYDSNKSGSFENNFNSTLNQLGSDGLVARYSNPDVALTTTADRSLKSYYDMAVKQYGPSPTGSQYLATVGQNNAPAAAAIIGASIKNA